MMLFQLGSEFFYQSALRGRIALPGGRRWVKAEMLKI